MHTSRRLILSPLLLAVVALASVIGVATSSTAAGPGPDTRVRANATVTVDAVGQRSSETAGGVGCLRPAQSDFVSAPCVATESVNPRDVHGELADVDVDVAHVKADGDLYIQDDGQLVRVLDNGNGTSDVVVYDPSNPTCAPTTKIKNMPNRQVQSRIDSGRWS